MILNTTKIWWEEKFSTQTIKNVLLLRDALLLKCQLYSKLYIQYKNSEMPEKVPFYGIWQVESLAKTLKSN